MHCKEDSHIDLKKHESKMIATFHYQLTLIYIKQRHSCEKAEIGTEEKMRDTPKTQTQKQSILKKMGKREKRIKFVKQERERERFQWLSITQKTK